VSQLEALDPPIILGNTYHLGHRPGPEVLREMGGLHKFMDWKKNLLTDSGGFQMVSLLKLAEITEEGVKFESPHDGSEMVLTPEKSMQIQNDIGADIMMALDDVVSSTTTGPRVEEAMYRTLRWIDRCIAAHKRPHDQNLFGIVQGGLDPNLRKLCAEGLVKRNLPGYAIGGLSGGESKDHFWRMVTLSTDILPENKPRYCMGVGFPQDLIVCVALGVDMFDCVYPTRTARFGSALVSTTEDREQEGEKSKKKREKGTTGDQDTEEVKEGGGVIALKQNRYANDFRPLEPDCNCMTCKNYTRAYLHTVSRGDQIGGILLSVHNIAYQLRLLSRARESIINNAFPEFVRKFFFNLYPKCNYPSWCIDALQSVNIQLIYTKTNIPPLLPLNSNDVPTTEATPITSNSHPQQNNQ